MNTAFSQNLQDRLRSLGLRTDARTVREVVAHLQNGTSLYSMYHGESPLVHKRTAEKIRDLYNTGQLAFILQKIEPSALIDRVYPFLNETHKERMERETLTENLSQRTASTLLGNARPPTKDFLAYHRMEVIDGLPSLDWTVSGLEAAHIPKDEVLPLLSNYDGLHLKRITAEVHETRMHGFGRETEKWMADFRGIDRYVAIHYLVSFAAQHEDAPYSLLEQAATLTAKGILGLDSRLRAAGTNLVRYEVWRGWEYLEAYLESVQLYYRSKRHRERVEREVRELLASVDGKENEE